MRPTYLRWTELLTERSTDYAAPSIEDYAECRAAQLEFWKSQNGKLSGDPAKLAQALLTIAGQGLEPRRFIAGADAIGTAEQKVADLGDPDRHEPGPFDVARFRLGVHRNACGRTSIRIVRSAFEFCVRTVSDAPSNLGQTR